MAEISYRIIRSRRRSLAIEIDRSAQVLVRAPYRMPDDQIREFVAEKSGWIWQHQEIAKRRIRQNAVSNPWYPIRQADIRRLKEQEAAAFPPRVARYAALMGVTYGRITIRCQKTRWGSCSAKGNLNFNCLQMLAPQTVQDYVIVHELAHRKQMNHSAAFWKEVERVLPDYRDSERWLRENGGLLIRAIADEEQT